MEIAKCAHDSDNAKLRWRTDEIKKIIVSKEYYFDLMEFPFAFIF